MKSSLLHGVLGALSFLVLAQGYRLLFEPTPGLLPLLGAAILVALTATAATYVALPVLE